jgi:hypothetical protein
MRGGSNVKGSHELSSWSALIIHEGVSLQLVAPFALVMTISEALVSRNVWRRR